MTHQPGLPPSDSAATVAGRSAWQAWSSVWRVFWEPGAEMADLAKRPILLPAYVAAMVLMLVGVFFTADHAQKIALAGAIKQMQAQGQTAQVAQVEQAVQAMGALTTWLTYGTALLTPWLYGVAMGLLMLLLGALRGGTEGFRKYLSVAGYGFLPIAIGTLVKSPLVLRTETAAQLQQVGLGPVVIFPGASGAMLGLLQSLDMFNIWSLVLLAMGFAAVHRLPPARGWYAGLVLWALQAAWQAGISAVGALFMSAA